MSLRSYLSGLCGTVAEAAWHQRHLKASSSGGCLLGSVACSTPPPLAREASLPWLVSFVSYDLCCIRGIWKFTDLHTGMAAT